MPICLPRYQALCGLSAAIYSPLNAVEMEMRSDFTARIGMFTGRVSEMERANTFGAFLLAETTETKLLAEHGLLASRIHFGKKNAARQ